MAALPLAAGAQPRLVADGLLGSAGSAVGPDGALYVTEGAVGRIARIDTATGMVTTFADGLPPALLPIGGVADVAFIGNTAYALVTMVGADLGGNSIVGVYRIDGPHSHTIIADLGAWALDNPPGQAFPYFIPTGVHYAMEAFRGGLLVTDGHLNRVLWVTLDGEISEFMGFGNIVPTGLEVWGNTIYMAKAGPVPHDPADGQVVTFGPKSTEATVVAAGAPLMVDVRRGRGAKLYALAQGPWDGAFEGSAALPDTGMLLEVRGDGSLVAIAEGLNLPTSLQVIGNTAYVVSLAGEVWAIDDISAPPFGR